MKAPAHFILHVILFLFDSDFFLYVDHYRQEVGESVQSTHTTVLSSTKKRAAPATA